MINPPTLTQIRKANERAKRAEEHAAGLREAADDLTRQLTQPVEAIVPQIPVEIVVDGQRFKGLIMSLQASRDVVARSSDGVAFGTWFVEACISTQIELCEAVHGQQKKWEAS